MNNKSDNINKELDKSVDISIIVFFIICTLLILSVYVINQKYSKLEMDNYFDQQNNNTTHTQEIEEQPNGTQNNTGCTENMVCNINNCEGIQYCTNNKLGKCTIEKECKPEQTRGCRYDSCRSGTQTCNNCGKWSSCEI